MEKINEKIIVRQTELSIDFLGHFIIQLKSDPNKTLVDFIAEWQNSIHWDKSENYSIVNQGVILTHLYGLIVYPKEIFHNDIPQIRLKDINYKSWGNFEILSMPQGEIKILGEKKVFTNEDELTLEYLIRKIRNSLSHASVEIFDNMDFIFIDKDQSKIKFSISGLQTFTKKFMNSYLSQKWE